MRSFFLILLTLVLFACNQQTEPTQILQNRIDSLETKLADTYKPGFGDFMSSIQTHHSKLWFAGLHENWPLAEFEVHELMDAIEDIEEFHEGRKETQLIGMILPPLDSISKAIDQKNTALFKSSYGLLTNTCNQCHKAVDMEFIVIKTPDTAPFTNQEFEPVK